MFDYLLDLLLMLAASAFGSAAGCVLSLGAILVWLARVIWTLIMQFFSLLIEWANEHWYGLEIADNPLLRALVCGAVGLVIGIGILWFGALLIGRGDLSCLFVLVTGFTLFVGVMADPDKDWAMPAFPGLSGRGPQPPLNV